MKISTRDAAPTRRKAITTLASVLAVGMVPATQAQDGHAHGADGTGHDEVHMPGLRGLDATPHESNEIAELFRKFHLIDRKVINLPNGIETRTYSSDPDLMSVIVSHVTGMIARVEEGRDPKILIQSPTLEILFERNDRLETSIDIDDSGIVVTQTSNDDQVVAALQTHADEVSQMADRGMHAVHEMMMKRAGNG